MISNILFFVIIIILILCVGFFTSSETAYLSLSKLKVRHMEENGVKGSKIVARLKANMDRLLTTVLVGTNFLNSLVSALATAFVVKIFGGGGVGLPTLVTAFFITTFGQIIPKTLAGINPEKIACFTALALSILEKIFFPIIWLFERLSHSVIYIVEKIIKPRENLVTEEELKTLIEVGEREGTIEKDESKMLNKIITFNNLNVSDIMRHRSLVSSLEINSDYNTVIEEYKKTGYSNIIIYKENQENVVGVLNYKSLLFSSQNTDLEYGFISKLMDEVFFVPGTFNVIELLQKFRSNGEKFAVVLNEQGEMQGIVTMEDIIKVVFGRMTDENHYDSLPAEDKIKLINHNTFLVPGELKIEDVNEILGLKLDSEDMNSIGGWLLEQFGHLPSIGNAITKDNVLFTVDDVYQRRITSIRIKKS